MDSELQKLVDAVQHGRIKNTTDSARIIRDALQANTDWGKQLYKDLATVREKTKNAIGVLNANLVIQDRELDNLITALAENAEKLKILNNIIGEN